MPAPPGPPDYLMLTNCTATSFIDVSGLEGCVDDAFPSTYRDLPVRVKVYAVFICSLLYIYCVCLF